MIDVTCIAVNIYVGDGDEFLRLRDGRGGNRTLRDGRCIDFEYYFQLGFHGINFENCSNV